MPCAFEWTAFGRGKGALRGKEAGRRGMCNAFRGGYDALRGREMGRNCGDAAAVYKDAALRCLVVGHKRLTARHKRGRMLR